MPKNQYHKVQPNFCKIERSKDVIVIMILGSDRTYNYFINSIRIIK